MWHCIPWVGRRKQRDAHELVLQRAAIEQSNERDAAFRRILRLARQQ